MGDAGIAHLLARAGIVEDRVRALVELRRRDDPAPDDPFRGLYLTDEGADRLLDPPPPAALLPDEGVALAVIEDAADRAEEAGEGVRLRRLARDAHLTALDVELLLVALVPDLDSRFERLYGYLNDDVTRRRATVGLALELTGAAPASGVARARLASGAPLLDRGLVEVEDAERPFLTRGLRVPDRVTAHLLGGDTPDPALAGVLADVTPYGAVPGLAEVLRAGVRLVYLRERVVGTGASGAVAALAGAGWPAVCLDFARLAAAPNPRALIEIAGREALLRGAGLVAGPVERLAGTTAEAFRGLAAAPVPVVLVGSGTWDPTWTELVPLLVDLVASTPAERAEVWLRELGEGAPDLADATAHFLLGPGQVARAVSAARASALLAQRPVSADELRRGARAQNAAGLERLARRVEPGVGWADLVLPAGVDRQLRELADRARNRDTVLTEWKMRPGGGRGRGIVALFAGDSGTGKTMSAEVVAGELGLDLYTVNLATVVDKYVGETEKNLERIFAEASGVNAVLLFDEADAIFGKRSEVRDAHDRYANIESAYLLQRMETFDGLAVLATNLRSNIDEAFTRRLDSIIDFAAPDEPLRRSLWERCLAPPLPCDPDLDLDFCARSFTLSGGNIRSIAVTAAYLAAGADRPVGMAELIAAVQQEYRKLGRLVLEREFGPYLARLNGG